MITAFPRSHPLADTVVQYSMTLPNSRSNENEADLIVALYRTGTLR